MRISINRISYLVCMALVIVIFFIGYVNDSPLEMICAACAVLFWLAQLRLLSCMDKDESAQKKKCRTTGPILLFAALGIMACGMWVLFQQYTGLTPITTYSVIAVSTILVIWLIVQIIALWNIKSLAGRFLRLTLSAATSIPLSLIIVLILHITGSEEAAELSCLSVMVFGGLVLLTAINMIIVSFCGYKSTRDSIKTIRGLIKNNRLVFTRVSIIKDVVLVAGKTVISIISLSFFMFANALYSTGMGIARFLALKMHSQDKKAQITTYRYVGIIITISSICYVLYSVRLFFGGKSGVYDMNTALAIACYTFVEFGVNIRDAVKLHKSKALEAKALRTISLSSTLLCFVLTQTAIMSFANEGDNSFSNALSGVVFGGVAALIGLYVVLDSFSQKKASNLL